MGRPSKYPPEFRAEAVELVKTSDCPRVEVARSLGISDNTLANWVIADREARSCLGADFVSLFRVGFSQHGRVLGRA
jgi:transposase-like protein